MRTPKSPLARATELPRRAGRTLPPPRHLILEPGVPLRRGSDERLTAKQTDAAFKAAVTNNEEKMTWLGALADA